MKAISKFSYLLESGFIGCLFPDLLTLYLRAFMSQGGQAHGKEKGEIHPCKGHAVLNTVPLCVNVCRDAALSLKNLGVV